jgi:3-methyladenine DNA glycosylase/8-oxoguanine DNA glycosylase
MDGEMQITTRRFDFESLVFSHGWVSLSPWRCDRSKMEIARPLALGRGRSVDARLRVRNRGDKSVVICNLDGQRVSPRERERLRSQIRRMLCLDIDYTEFQAACKGDRILNFVSAGKCGGILRSPSLLEDLVKTACTVNCAWANTRRMCEALCNLNEGTFPSPRKILEKSVEELRTVVPLGYRAETVNHIARRVDEGNLPLDLWSSQGQFDKIRSTLESIPGFGPYSVNHMLVLLGHYGEVPIDSEVLKYIRNNYFDGTDISVNQADSPFREYGKYKFLAYKFSRIARRRG